MINKKIIIISTIIAIIVIGLIVYIFLSRSANRKQDEATFKEISSEFVEKWGSFSYKNTDQYLPNIKPYITSEFYNEMEEHDIVARAKENLEMMKYEVKVTPEKITILKMEKDETTVLIKVKREESFEGGQKEENREVIIEFIEENGENKINNAEFKD